jgi:hypothetical protein
MTMTFLTSTRFLPYSIAPLSRYASGRGASSTRAHRRAERVNFLDCCHDGVLGDSMCVLVVNEVARMLKDRIDAREAEEQSRSKMLGAFWSARVADAMTAVG